MKFNQLMVHFGELSTKGNNRKLFVTQLRHNIRVALKSFDVGVSFDHAHIYVHLRDNPYEPVLHRLQEVSGIQRISLVASCSLDVDDICASAVSLMANEPGKTLKVDVKRANKEFPMDHYAITVKVADAVLASRKDLGVDLHNPDILLRVSIREHSVDLSCHEFPGLGGYPLGMNGKVMMLLSGGIDSPVAAYRLIRRGIVVECCHFASPPYTQMAVIDKLKDILVQLNAYQNDIRLNVVPFTKLQEAIYAHVAEPYCITIMRRMMVRIAVGLAKKHNAKAIATGESIGQVASQTLESLQVINEVTNYPILRPLATEDKVAIINDAQRIHTFDISIRPYEDCCTIFKPKKPKTKPRLDECEKYEATFDWAPMVEECIENAYPIYLSGGEEVLGKDSKSQE